MKLSNKLVIVAALCSINAYANDVYLEQVGDGSTITITQQGTGNSAGDSLNPVYIDGGANIVTIDQIGDGNTLAMTLNGAGAGAVITTNGDNNIQSVTCGSLISASCIGSDIKQTTTGSSNTITQSVTGKHKAWSTVTGDSNTVNMTSTTNAATQSSMVATVTGNLNTVTISQAGTAANNAVITTTGSSNNISISQHQ